MHLQRPLSSSVYLLSSNCLWGWEGGGKGDVHLSDLRFRATQTVRSFDEANSLRIAKLIATWTLRAVAINPKKNVLLAISDWMTLKIFAWCGNDCTSFEDRPAYQHAIYVMYLHLLYTRGYVLSLCCRPSLSPCVQVGSDSRFHHLRSTYKSPLSKRA